MIESGRLIVNGSTAVLSTRVDESDEVLMYGKPVGRQVKSVYLALNKPVGIICTTVRSIKHNIIGFINYPKRIFPIGRLDRPSEGLIFPTNDVNIVNKILRAGNNYEKEYIVTDHKPVAEDFIRQMASGIPNSGYRYIKMFCKTNRFEPVQDNPYAGPQPADTQNVRIPRL